MIECVAGLPGSGKGLLSTLKAVRFHHSAFGKKLLKAANAGLSAENQLKTLIFSNYPILLDEKKQVYSNYISFENLTTDPNKCFYLPQGAYIIIDEAQKYYDSREFSKFPKKIGTFLQHHRHGGIYRVIVISQDPGRLDTKVRNLCETYTRIVKSRMFWGIGFIRTNTYYRYEDYGKPCPKKTVFTKVPTQALAGGYYDYDKKTYFFFTKRVFKAYDTKYFRFFFDRMPVLPYKKFTDKTLSQEDLIKLGLDDEMV